MTSADPQDPLHGPMVKKLCSIGSFKKELHRKHKLSNDYEDIGSGFILLIFICFHFNQINPSSLEYFGAVSQSTQVARWPANLRSFVGLAKEEEEEVCEKQQ